MPILEDKPNEILGYKAVEMPDCCWVCEYSAFLHQYGEYDPVCDHPTVKELHGVQGITEDGWCPLFKRS